MQTKISPGVDFLVVSPDNQALSQKLQGEGGFGFQILRVADRVPVVEEDGVGGLHGLGIQVVGVGDLSGKDAFEIALPLQVN